MSRTITKRKRRRAKREGELTEEEIRRRYPKSWVLLDDPVTDRALQLLYGRAVYHSSDPDETTRQIGVLGLHRSMVLFTGPIPKAIFLL